MVLNEFFNTAHAMLVNGCPKEHNPLQLIVDVICQISSFYVLILYPTFPFILFHEKTHKIHVSKFNYLKILRHWHFLFIVDLQKKNPQNNQRILHSISPNSDVARESGCMHFHPLGKKFLHLHRIFCKNNTNPPRPSSFLFFYKKVQNLLPI